MRKLPENARIKRKRSEEIIQTINEMKQTIESIETFAQFINSPYDEHDIDDYLVELKDVKLPVSQVEKLKQLASELKKLNNNLEL